MDGDASVGTGREAPALSPEALRMVEYLRSRTAALGPAGIRGRVRAAAAELEAALAGVTEAEARAHPLAGEWSIAEVVDHVAQTTIRGADELRHLVAGRRPPAPPVYESLTSGAAAWAPWEELLEGLRSANAELDALLATQGGADAAADPQAPVPPTVRTILVVNRGQADGREAPEIFAAELGWLEYALVQRLHLLDHRTQVRKLRAALGR